MIYSYLFLPSIHFLQDLCRIVNVHVLLCAFSEPQQVSSLDLKKKWFVAVTDMRPSSMFSHKKCKLC